MIESNPPIRGMEAFPIPEGSIFLDSKDGDTSRELAISALKKTINVRNLTLSLGPVSELNNPQQLLILNRFSIQIITTGITADEVSISLEHWYKIDAAPQILLAAQIDHENNVVYFPGVITGPEFKKLVSNKVNNQKELSLPIDEFKGGVNRLFSFVRLLEPSAISCEGFANQSELSLIEIRKKLKTAFSIAALGAGVLVLGPEFFRPKLLGNLASLSGDPIEISTYTRSSKLAAPLKACLISPTFAEEKSGSNVMSIVSIDKPLIFSLDPLNEIKISSNGKTLWSKTGTPEGRIRGPIQWPIEPMKPGEKLTLSIRPKGTSFSEEAIIVLQATQKESFQVLDSVINSLGESDSRWVKIINRNLEKDRTLALALLFSKDSPKSVILNKARKILLNKKNCLSDN